MVDGETFWGEMFDITDSIFDAFGPRFGNHCETTSFFKLFIHRLMKILFKKSRVWYSPEALVLKYQILYSSVRYSSFRYLVILIVLRLFARISIEPEILPI